MYHLCFLSFLTCFSYVIRLYFSTSSGWLYPPLVLVIHVVYLSFFKYIYIYNFDLPYIFVSIHIFLFYNLLINQIILNKL